MHSMPKIVAVGGGGYEGRPAEKLFAELVRLSGKRRPRMLLIPTAGHDRPDVCERVFRAFGRQDARPDKLLLLTDPPPASTRREKLGAADIVWVSGGNTLKMMRRWRHLGVDRLLAAALERGAVLAGSSAGAICWCDYGHSDSMADYHPDDWQYIRVRGLGYVPVTFCPHYSEEGRQESFHGMIARHGGIGLAADEFCALVVIGRRYRILTTHRGAHAYRVTRRRGGVTVEPVAAGPSLRPLAELLAD